VTAPPAKLRTLLLGDVQHHEFTESFDWLGQHVDLTVANNLSEAKRIAIEFSPHLIVLALSRPGLFLQSELDQLNPIAPTAIWVSILGGGCEGEGRTGEPYPGVTRVYWHQWIAQASRQLELLAAGRPSVWGLPRTASDVDRFLMLGQEPIDAGQGLIAIAAETMITFEALTDPCRAAGFSTVWIQPRQRGPLQEGAVAGLCDFPSNRDRHFTRLKEVVDAIRPAPVLGVMNFPRRDDRLRVLELGAVGLISKPFLANDLLRDLQSALAAVDAPRATQ